MCLTLNKKFKTEKAALEASKNPLIAKKDMTVYKAVRPVNENKFQAIYQTFTFEKGYHYYQTGKEFSFIVSLVTYSPDSLYNLRVYRGLHSYIRKYQAQSKGHTERVIIPKGAKYFIGKNGDIVSNQLIFPHK